jgi:hypothetical protein
MICFKHRFIRQHLQKGQIGNLSDDQRDCNFASEFNPVIKKRKLENSVNDQSDALEGHVVGDLAKRIPSSPNVALECEERVPRNRQRRDGNDADTFHHYENINNLELLECDVQMTRDRHEVILAEGATAPQCDLVSSPLLPLKSENFGGKVQHVAGGVEKSSIIEECMLLPDISHQESDQKNPDGVQNSVISAEISDINSMEKNDEILQPLVTTSSEVFEANIRNESQTIGLFSGQLENTVLIEEGPNQYHHSQDAEKSHTNILSDAGQEDFSVTQEVSTADRDTKSYATLCENQSDILKATNLQDIQRIPQFIFSFKSPLSEFRGTLLRMLRDVVDLHSILLKNGTGEF